MEGNKLASFVKRNGSTILTVIGAAGVIGTAVLTGVGTIKAVKLAEQNPSFEETTVLEKVKVVWKPYIPATIAGATSILCIFGANGLSKKQLSALVSMYALAANSFSKYRQKAKELYGDDADEKIMEAVKADEQERRHDDILLFYDVYSSQYFNRSMAEVIDAEYNLNREFILSGGVKLNDFYELLGLDPIDRADRVGWKMDDEYDFYECQWIDFDHEFITTDDGLECYAISMVNKPRICFL